MNVVPFPARSPEPARTIAELRTRRRLPTPPTCEIAVTKAEHERRYVLRLEAPYVTQVEVWFGRSLHRASRAVGLLRCRMFADQFLREIEGLIADGWTETA